MTWDLDDYDCFEFPFHPFINAVYAIILTRFWIFLPGARLILILILYDVL